MRWPGAKKKTETPAAATSQQAQAQARAIDDFWTWWADTRPAIQAALADGDSGTHGTALTEAVRRIHPGLQWELSRRRDGSQSSSQGPDVFELTVTPGGHAEARSAAARWLLAAPPDTDGWQFHATRQPDPAALSRRLVHGPAETGIVLARTTVTITQDEQVPRLHLTVRNEQFEDLDDATAAAYLALDWALGEADVQRWIGNVTATAKPADRTGDRATDRTGENNTVPIAELPAAVAAFAEKHPRAYALVSAQVRGMPLTAIIQTPISPVDHPLLDDHIAVTVPYTTMNASRLQTGQSAQRMNDFDQALADLVGPDGQLLVAVSCDGQRVFHYYTDPHTDVAARIGAWQHGWPEGTVTIHTEHDPAWSAVQPFLF
ncbi:hypothetical protein GCM10009839_10440 [Catenulispora yoronensis]|uniref:DUF695 domain-containing protein n=1 Tax=Catenulispora yoronensis TaxID=450799 RepID=A0ABN2TRL9_9ACTN